MNCNKHSLLFSFVNPYGSLRNLNLKLEAQIRASTTYTQIL